MIFLPPWCCWYDDDSRDRFLLQSPTLSILTLSKTVQTVDTNNKTTTDTHSTLKYSQSIVTVESRKAHVIEIILVAVPEGTANRQIIDISYIATQTRKSLVKGERFIRAVWMAEMMPCNRYSSNCISLYHQVTESTSFRI